MTVDDIGIVKAISLDGLRTEGRLVQIDDNYYVSISDTSINESGNLSLGINRLVRVDPKTICAYTYQNDSYGNKIFNFDVLKIPGTDKLLYVTWDDMLGNWVYFASWDNSHEEDLNTNELLSTFKNILYDEDVCKIFENMFED